MSPEKDPPGRRPGPFETHFFDENINDALKL